MKLKKADIQNNEPENTVLAERFQLDAEMPEAGPSTAAKILTIVGLLAALGALALTGTVAALMYMNWDLIAQA